MVDAEEKLSAIVAGIRLRDGSAIGPPKKIILTKSDDAIEATEEPRHQLFSEIQLEDGPLKSPCWIFLGIQNSSGYGQLLHNGEFRAAHRVSWVIRNGYSGKYPEGAWS
jgi:hypothetical protein